MPGAVLTSDLPNGEFEPPCESHGRVSRTIWQIRLQNRHDFRASFGNARGFRGTAGSNLPLSTIQALGAPRIFRGWHYAGKMGYGAIAAALSGLFKKGKCLSLPHWRNRAAAPRSSSCVGLSQRLR